MRRDHRVRGRNTGTTMAPQEPPGLVAEGCGRYRVGPGPVWGEADVLSYAAWQRGHGYAGADADGIPGRVSWDRLRVPEAGHE